MNRDSWPAWRAAQLADVRLTVESFQVVGIDEGQFVSTLCNTQFPDLLEFAEELANRGVIVIVAMLSGTFQRKPFPSAQLAELIACAEQVTVLPAVCQRCGGEAPFSHRLTADTAVEVIGGSESYEALCRSCYNNNKKQQLRV